MWSGETWLCPNCFLAFNLTFTQVLRQFYNVILTKGLCNTIITRTLYNKIISSVIQKKMRQKEKYLLHQKMP